jgi:hypothetical protein
MPTISGRACAGDDSTIPTPMVTATAAAILNDIVLSIPQCPDKGAQLDADPEDAGLPHARIFNRAA